MRRDYHFWVYILASRSRNLYIGKTDNLIGRTMEYREATPGTHTAHYRVVDSFIASITGMYATRLRAKRN